MRKLLSTIAIVAGVTGIAGGAQAFSGPASVEAPDSNVVLASHGSCGWYAITVCTRGWSGAKRATYKYGGYVVNTSHISGFRNGWKCAVKGPTSKWRAKKLARKARHHGAYSAYVKHGCGH